MKNLKLLVTWGTAVTAAVAMDLFQDQVLHTSWPERPMLDATAATAANYFRMNASKYARSVYGAIPSKFKYNRSKSLD